MRRTPERRQLMDAVTQAKAYAESDFSLSHNRFVDLFTATFPDFSGGLVLDIACGDADPTRRFAKRYPDARIIGIDGSAPMLELAREAVEAESLSERVRFEQQMIGDMNFDDEKFDAIICNSALHHLKKPLDLWKAVRFLKYGSPFFAMDLTRPPSRRVAKKMVKEHKGDPRLMRKDFYASLKAAYRPEEVRSQLDGLGFANFHVEVVSNRHMAIYGTR